MIAVVYIFLGALIIILAIGCTIWLIKNRKEEK